MPLSLDKFDRHFDCVFYLFTTAACIALRFLQRLVSSVMERDGDAFEYIVHGYKDILQPLNTSGLSLQLNIKICSFYVNR